MVFSTLVEYFLEFLKFFQSTQIIGLIAFTMVCLMLFFAAYISLQNLHQNFCIGTVLNTLKSRNFVDSPLQHGEILNINSIISMYDYPALHSVWREYYNSIPIENNPKALASPVDAGVLFTLEKLNLTVRQWDRVASLFISIGLMLTFMGLVAALQQSGNAILTAGEEANDIKGALSMLLVVVSSKFILSITGLACAITLNLVIDARGRRNARLIAELTSSLNHAIRYIPVETLLMDMSHSLRKIDARGDVS